jgi:two-component system chemotaxis response regulator CheV
MPGLDGYELAFEVRDLAKLAGTNNILHSSLSSNMSLARENEVGADEALTKYEAQELVNDMLKGAKQK